MISDVIVTAAEILLAEVAHTVNGLRLNGVMTLHAYRLELTSDILRRAIDSYRDSKPTTKEAGG